MKRVKQGLWPGQRGPGGEAGSAQSLGRSTNGRGLGRARGSWVSMPTGRGWNQSRRGKGLTKLAGAPLRLDLVSHAQEGSPRPLGPQHVPLLPTHSHRPLPCLDEASSLLLPGLWTEQPRWPRGSSVQPVPPVAFHWPRRDSDLCQARASLQGLAPPTPPLALLDAATWACQVPSFLLKASAVRAVPPPGARPHPGRGLPINVAPPTRAASRALPAARLLSG